MDLLARYAGNRFVDRFIGRHFFSGPALHGGSRRERLLQLRPVIALAALDLRELADEGPPAPVQIVLDSLALRFEAEAGPALPVRADAEIGNESALMCWHERLPSPRSQRQANALDLNEQRSAHEESLDRVTVEIFDSNLLVLPEHLVAGRTSGSARCRHGLRERPLVELSQSA
jgi:hypothetical protein